MYASVSVLLTCSLTVFNSETSLKVEFDAAVEGPKLVHERIVLGGPKLSGHVEAGESKYYMILLDKVLCSTYLKWYFVVLCWSSHVSSNPLTQMLWSIARPFQVILIFMFTNRFYFWSCTFIYIFNSHFSIERQARRITLGPMKRRAAKNCS